MNADDPMRRVRELLGPGYPEERWRASRARNLAKILAWDRRYEGGSPTAGKIINDITDDIGWPDHDWLEAEVAKESAIIEANLAEFKTCGSSHEG